MSGANRAARKGSDFVKKRADPSDTEIEACKRQFLEDTAWRTLQRAVARLKKGEPIDQRDREFIALRLEALSEQELQKFKAMSIVEFRSHQAEYLHDKLRIPLDQAAAKVAGDIKPDSIRKAVDRRRGNRRARRGWPLSEWCESVQIDRLTYDALPEWARPSAMSIEGKVIVCEHPIDWLHRVHQGEPRFQLLKKEQTPG
jgi:hypothetical protein